MVSSKHVPSGRGREPSSRERPPQLSERKPTELSRPGSVGLRSDKNLEGKLECALSDPLLMDLRRTPALKNNGLDTTDDTARVRINELDAEVGEMREGATHRGGPIFEKRGECGVKSAATWIVLFPPYHHRKMAKRKLRETQGPRIGCLARTAYRDWLQGHEITETRLASVLKPPS